MKYYSRTLFKKIVKHLVIFLTISCLFAAIIYFGLIAYNIYGKLEIYQKYHMSDDLYTTNTYLEVTNDLSKFYDGLESAKYQDWIDSMIYLFDVERFAFPWISKHSITEIYSEIDQNKQATLIVPKAILGNLIKSEFYIYCFELEKYNDEEISEREKINRAKLYLECAYINLMFDIIHADKPFHYYKPKGLPLEPQKSQQYPRELKIFKNKNLDIVRNNQRKIVCESDDIYCGYENIRWQIGLCEREIFFQNNKECITSDIVPLIQDHKFCKDLSFSSCKLIEKYLKHHVFSLFTG